MKDVVKVWLFSERMLHERMAQAVQAGMPPDAQKHVVLFLEKYMLPKEYPSIPENPPKAYKS